MEKVKEIKNKQILDKQNAENSIKKINSDY